VYAKLWVDSPHCSQYTLTPSMPAIWRGESATTSYTIPESVAVARTLPPDASAGGEATAAGSTDGVGTDGNAVDSLQPASPGTSSKHVIPLRIRIVNMVASRCTLIRA
jgi:hypothetical protein